MTTNFSPRSSAQTERVSEAQSLIPGGSTNSLLPPDGLEFLAKRGKGPYIYDEDDRQFLDFMLGAGPLVLGHAHPRIVETIARQAQNGTHYFGLAANALDLAKRVVDLVPSAEMVRYTSSGSEATFHALRLARAVTGRRAIIKFDGAWHGHHDLAVFSMEYSPTRIPVPYAVSNGIQTGVTDDIVVLPYNDAPMVRDMLRAYPGRFAAVICEPMQRTLSPVPGFLETVREECDRAGTVLIFDEVVTGFRVAPGGAQEKYGITPDLTALGKAFGGGMPLAAVVGRRWLMEHLDPTDLSNQYSFHCGTFNGLPVSIACGQTAIDMLVNEGGIERLAHLGRYARDKVTALFHDLKEPVCVTGGGPIFHFYFTEETVQDHAAVRRARNGFSDAIHRRMYAAGIYKQFSKAYLSIAHDESHIDAFCDVLGWAYRTELDSAA